MNTAALDLVAPGIDLAATAADWSVRFNRLGAVLTSLGRDLDLVSTWPDDAADDGAILGVLSLAILELKAGDAASELVGKAFEAELIR